ncbi:mitochondrial carrier domain-containing protein [Baffinella frigidus]|nr:mitochondrial carrier domain-containing protein [Cryptophyta sp. CCMP2293]
MSAGSKMAPELKREYKSCLDCIVRTTQEEGITKLWSGGVPTVIRATLQSASVLGCYSVIRATLLSASVLGCYSEAKERLHDKFPKVFPNKEGVPLMFTSTMMASLVATAVSNPFDVVKSRVQV